MSGASLGALPPAGWASSTLGGIENGEPQCKEDEEAKRNAEEYASFKHSQSLEPEDVWMMKVCTKVFGIGVVAEGFDVERHVETEMSTARLDLSNAPNDMGEHGSTVIFRDISEDGEQHSGRILKDHIPKTLPYDLALRINKDGNMPQVRFNEDGQWHDFAPEGGTGLKACRASTLGGTFSNLTQSPLQNMLSVY